MLYGNDMKDCCSASLSKHISYVSQDVSLFSGTLYDNIVLHQKNVSQSEIKEAIQDACLEELVALRGLYGKSDENGNNFSGGEKQRIDVARALVQNTSILVLDEATSALDIHTEEKLINQLRKKNKTVIYVAHRLSTVQHCDQIIVMKNGLIAEQGNHHDLSVVRGIYYHLLQNEDRKSVV